MAEHPDQGTLACLEDADEATRAHVADCAACQEALAWMKRVEDGLRTSAPDIEIPAAVDLEIRGRLPRRRPTWILALVASLAIVAVIPFVLRNLEQRDAPTTPTADLNDDGRVDVRDAVTLSSALRAGTAPLSWDVDRDGTVDQDDVEHILTIIVDVEGEAYW